MKLVSLKYSENFGQNQEWILNKLTLGNKNLIVGRNSAGKTRTLSVIGSLARALYSPQFTMNRSCHYYCEWLNVDDVSYIYEYTINDGLVVFERLTIGGQEKIERREIGVGSIFYEDLNGGQFLAFKVPEGELAIKRRDALQHPFLEPLHQWASEVRHYYFGSPFGKEHMAVFGPNMPSVDEKDPSQTVGLLRNAIRSFGKKFLNLVLSDMQSLGYNLEILELGFPVSIDPMLVPPGLNCIRVKERGVKGYVDQVTMSQGMYRVLALLININYLMFKKTSTCVIIDDIGEGLDFERSCELISLLRKKADVSNIQIIMSTNDKFVMNEVPLSEWTVLSRDGGEVHVSNYSNSKQKFDDFKFTGLSNFSFFEMDYLRCSESGDD
ncbi:ATP-binding protein [Pseudomonas proteolytica]|uniref:ATP-binding protein n=1 Tax=Pseudomonas proteolytica TaxID=219574 RepID=UPI001646BE64|nr:ATP-binding protein [Pseudomonas proteolytica]MBC3339332.1 ATP-binding protein [Pseudomonas proteolytica]